MKKDILYCVYIVMSPVQIYSWMDTLVAQYPKLVTKQEIGRSYENRPMYVLKVRHVTSHLYYYIILDNTIMYNTIQYCTILYILLCFISFIRCYYIMSIDCCVCSSALEETSVLPSGWTQGSTPESGCPRPPGCGQPTRYNMPTRQWWKVTKYI